MGGMALLAREMGYRVTGCDANVYPPMSDQLRAAGIELIEGYDADQLKLKPDVFVVGNAITRGNALMEAVLDARAPFVSGPQWVGEHLLRERWVLAVAGTHGKSTGASMLAWILEVAGKAPGFLVGGVAKNFGISARSGGSDGAQRYFVIEADEYDTAFFDKRSKFLHYLPQTLVLNNLEFDHADIFPDLAAIETQFHHLVRVLARSARIVVNAQDAALARVLARGCWSACEGFGPGGQWQVMAEAPHTVFYQDRAMGQMRLQLAGAHNRANALAAIAAAHHAGVPVQLALEAMTEFVGVKRRLELRDEVGGVRVLDDFAHHPTAIKETIAAVRSQSSEGGRVVAILEPRSNTMKLGTMAPRLVESLSGADVVYCFAGKGVNWDAAQVLSPLGAKATVWTDLDAMAARIAQQARSGDQLLFMSNGAFGGIQNRVSELLRVREPA